ncbi:maleylpyruvate isomerase N-terminal domain-containing protein [Occallatibacter savannae]|uniref:maleylpyruvate isomerase N-terminal domain-containing protein n=1 Tax=Occallatibacter savannae TaxID=1002691 RepID=UPI000D687A69|nr:maleylpyruvate isomerase N-terminal domain-containing protein [Occallatibacter savannae]
METNSQLGGSEPIICAHLLRKVDAALLELLRSLTVAEWDLQTVAPRWKVRDVAAHLLDTALRKLSLVRDSCFVENVRLQSPQDVVAYVNRLNNEGVTVYRRLSPAAMIDLTALACDQSASFHESLDPYAPATFNVSWAGEDKSLNWFDTARELTERWHHQQQIRLATGQPGIMIRELYHPVLDCFVRGLPHSYRDMDAPAGTSVLLEISGESGGEWAVSRDAKGWSFAREYPKNIACKVILPDAIAWRVFTKGISRDAVRSQINVEGNEALVAGILGLTAIVG